MSKVKLAYGYSIVQIAQVNVLTAKIRIKVDLETVNEFFAFDYRVDNVITLNEGNNETVIISWATTDHTKHQEFVGRMNRLMAYVMHKRIAVKYGELVDQVPDLAW